MESLKPVYQVTTQETSQRGQSILVIRKENDPEFSPTMSQVMPTKVAEWIEALADLEMLFAQHLKRFSR